VTPGRARLRPPRATSRAQLEAFNESQRYKEGKTILERAYVVKRRRPVLMEAGAAEAAADAAAAAAAGAGAPAEGRGGTAAGGAAGGGAGGAGAAAAGAGASSSGSESPAAAL
jgi:hypothetical protein